MSERDKMELKEVLKELPGLDCKECGFKSCEKMAAEILEGQRSLDDCVILDTKKEVILEINGKEIPTKLFVQEFIKKTVLGMISALKKVNLQDKDVIKISIKVEEDDIR